MSFTKIATIVQVSDSEDYSSNFGQLPTPAYESTADFLGRVEVPNIDGDTSADGTLLGVPAAATRILVHNKSTTTAATVFVNGTPDVNVLKVGAGETSVWAVAASVSPANYGAFSASASVLVDLVVMFWG